MKVADPGNITALSMVKPAELARSPFTGSRDAKDRVSTADSAKIAAAISRAGQGAGAARSAKLASIEAAVRQGTYRPDPQRIAQEILNDAELAAKLQSMFQK